MRLKITLLSLLLLATLGWSQSAKAVEPDIVVALDGSGDFTSIQDAINAAPSNLTSRRTVIFIKNGLYDTEKLIVPSTKKNLTFIGESREQTIISYHIHNCGSDMCPAEDAAKWSGDLIRTAATLTIQADGFRAENLTIANTAGATGQAQAITLWGADKISFYNVTLTGYQDTIYFWNSKRAYFENCLVTGRTDYIYGTDIGFFESCEIRSYGGGWITAPSTSKDAEFGFVFNNCDITYSNESPSPGDNGGLVRLGRPWHNYPKVAWINCNMTEKIHPEGWGDKWNMDYSDTSTDLHLYEYNNTGAGADMSGRADWAGLRALTPEEAANYTRENVVGGNDNWAPWEDEPLSKSYTWDGGGADANWLTPENWNPDGVPAAAESATVDGDITIEANGETFYADLFLKNGATLKLTDDGSRANYLSGEDAFITSDGDFSLSGKINNRGNFTVSTDVNIDINSILSGVKPLIKEGTGSVNIKGNNRDYYGYYIVNEGSLVAQRANTIGNVGVDVNDGGTLVVENNSAIFPEAYVKLVTGAKLVLNEDVTTSQFYINGDLKGEGTYNATTYPDYISGEGAVLVGRPASFTFSGGAWSDVVGYTPALLPEAGEKVFCEGEMETAGDVNLANVTFVNGKGSLRLRGVHTSEGSLTFEGNQRIGYATSGTGFTLEAPIVFEGPVNLEMSSANEAGSSMTFLGTIAGGTEIFPKNTRDIANVATVMLEGDNANFSGIWNITTPARTPGGSVGITGTSENAFGPYATILVGADNFVQIDHAQATQYNVVEVAANGKIIANADITVGQLKLGNELFTSGTYSSTSHPDFIEGSGTIMIGGLAVGDIKTDKFSVYYQQNVLYTKGNVTALTIYSVDGKMIHKVNVSNSQANISLNRGVYLVADQNNQVIKMIVTD